MPALSKPNGLKSVNSALLERTADELASGREMERVAMLRRLPANDLEAMQAAFDPKFFRKKYCHSVSVRKSANLTLEVYLCCVLRYPVDPRADFSESYYLDQHADVRSLLSSQQLQSGFHHWALYGRKEFRVHHPEIAATAEQARAKILVEHYFDADRYTKRYMGSRKPTRSEALLHFLKIGIRKGAVPVNPDVFDESFYTSYYDDVGTAKKAGLIPSGFFHFVSTGHEEGRLARRNTRLSLERKLGAAAEPVGIGRLDNLQAKLLGLEIRLDPSRPRAINVFIPTLDPDIMFGGYVAFLHFLCRLSEADYRLRFILMEDADCGKEWFLGGIRDKPRWLAAFTSQEFCNLTRRGRRLPCNPADACIAYSTWTMYNASSVAKQLLSGPPVFFIQEYEPIFHEHGSIHFLSAAAYRLPHFAIFNSEILESYFRVHEIGVFARGGGSYLTFEHALSDARPNPRFIARTKRARRLLCYARPEAHAARNLFEICVIALRAARRAAVFQGDWEFVGVGSLGKEYEIDIAGQPMRIIPKLQQNAYESLLSSFDVGLSLMWAPHPSVLPFELARAGVVTVTNEFVNRSVEQLVAFGYNIVPCEPTVAGVVEALGIAVQRARNTNRRLKGAKLVGPRSWDDVFDAAFIGRLSSVLGRSGGAQRPTALRASTEQSGNRVSGLVTIA